MRRQVPQYIINVRLPIAVAEKLDAVAYAEHSTRTEEIRKAVVAYVEAKTRQEAENGAEG
jgi:predicted transcriptional regulator